VRGQGYLSETIPVTVSGSEMTQTVTMTTPAIPTYTYHGTLMVGGEPFSTGGDDSGVYVSLVDQNGVALHQKIVADSSGRFSFEESSPETTQPAVTYRVRVECNSVSPVYCIGTSSARQLLPDGFAAVTAQPITFTASNNPTFNIPVTHVLLTVINPDG